ncbi:hypothetical protein MMC22_004520 [Lobaria immixta]|nr:hypothetical protein [Lobaria immixta]
MPTYYSKRTTIQLAVVNLEATTTTDPRFRVGIDQAEKLDNDATEFAQASQKGTMKESPVSNEDPPRTMGYLGFDKDMPFFMVHAGVDLYGQSHDKTHTRKPERVPETPETKAFTSHPPTSRRTSLGRPYPGKANDHLVDPKAELEDDRQRKLPRDVQPYGLCLIVFLTPDSFLAAPEQGSKRLTFNDIKIDVFFNGELCGSSFVPERHHGNVYQMSEHIIRFSGRRIGRLVEKPWVIVPEGQNADGTFREHHRGEEGYAGAEPRWSAISEALAAEAERVGQDEFGAFSLLGEYLTTLASLSMPAKVEEMQKAGGPKFGVIDVVVIAGKGQKDDAKNPSLTEPTAIRSKAYRPEVRKHQMNQSPISLQSPIPSVNNNNETDLTASSEKLKASIESFGQQFQNSLGSSSRTGSFGRVGRPIQTLSSKPDKQWDSSPFASRHNTPCPLPGSSSLQNSLGNTSVIKSLDATGKPIQRSSSEHDEQHGSPATTSNHNTLFSSSGLSLFRRERQTFHTFSPPKKKDVQVVKGQHLDQSTSIPDSHIGHEAIVPSGSTSVSGLLDRNRNEDPLPPPSAIVPRPKDRRRMPYEYVLDSKLTESEEFDSVLAKAKQMQLEMRDERKGEHRVPVLRSARASRSDVADRGASTLAGPSKVVVTNVEQPKLIIKLRTGGEPAPSAPLNTQPNTSVRPSTPSLTSTPASRPAMVVTPAPRKSGTNNSSSTTPALYSGPGAAPRKGMWSSPPPLSEDSVLTYAADDLVRSIKVERNGWFEERDVIMGVRFLVG